MADVSVDIRGEELIVSGQKYVTEVDLWYQVARRVPGPAFRRVYRIPRDVAVDNIAAAVEGNVLVLQLPKVQEVRDASLSRSNLAHGCNFLSSSMSWQCLLLQAYITGVRLGVIVGDSVTLAKLCPGRKVQTASSSYMGLLVDWGESGANPLLLLRTGTCLLCPHQHSTSSKGSASAGCLRCSSPTCPPVLYQGNTDSAGKTDMPGRGGSGCSHLCCAAETSSHCPCWKRACHLQVRVVFFASTCNLWACQCHIRGRFKEHPCQLSSTYD